MISGLTIIDASRTEHKLLMDAKGRYGKAYENAENMVDLVWNFLKSIELEAWVFTSFLAQVQKFALLSLLSTVRQHNAQAQMNMRQVFEAGVLAAYALTEKDVAAYTYADKHGIGRVKENAKTKAYKWLEKNYKNYSDLIKIHKDEINNLWAHSNILLTPLNSQTRDQNKTFLNSFFDEDDDFMTKNHLWFIANSCFGLLDLFAKVINTTKMAKLADDFEEKMKQYGDENETIKKELMQNPRLTRW